MYIKPSRRKMVIRQVSVYIIMVSTVLVVVSALTFFMLGYTLKDGKLEQNAFLQFNSNPSNATVAVDGTVINSKTPSKTKLPAGKHKVAMWRDGYETWNKSVDLKSGTLTWLNYTLLIPKSLTVESVMKFDSLASTLSSVKGSYMIIQKSSDKPTLDLIDFTSENIKSKSISIPSNIYSDPNTVGVKHKFTIEKWDDGERYVLINHTFGDKGEWLVMDTQGDNSVKNISKSLNVSIDRIVFYGTNGNSFYALNNGDVRKLDLSAGTISKPLVSNVVSFEIYNDSKVITYLGTASSTNGEKVVGVYRDGDDKPTVLKTLPANDAAPLHIATSHYFGSDYVAISVGKKVSVLSGSYPKTTSADVNSLRSYASFEFSQDVASLSFSPSGEYVFTQSDKYFSSYDLEHQQQASSTMEGESVTPSFKWLDGNHIWSSKDGKLTIREFDGENSHLINTAVAGQDISMTNSGRYIYSLGSTKTGYQLQRVRMILP